jgi:spermidine/putrescine transport system substrate-binding protein
MNKIFKISLLVFVSSNILVSCNTDKSKLKIYNWGMYIGKNTISDFEKKYNCEVVYDNYLSNEEMIAKLKAGVSYDIIFPTDYAIKILKTLNLIQKLDHSKLTNITHIDSKFLNLSFDPKNEYSIPYHWGTSGIGYDSSKIKNISSYSDLWNEKYKNKIAVVDDPRFVIGTILIYLGYSPNTTKITELNKAKEILSKIMKNSKSMYNTPTIFSSGEVEMVFGYSSGIFQMSATQNNKIKYTIPKEGTLLWFDSMCIPIKSENPKLAHNFINYILEPKVIAEISNEIFAANANKDSKNFLTQELKNNKDVYLSSKNMKKAYFIKDLGEKNKLYLNIWQDMKISN